MGLGYCVVFGVVVFVVGGGSGECWIGDWFNFYYKGSNVKDYIVVWVCINIIEIKDFKGVLYFGVWLV